MIYIQMGYFSIVSNFVKFLFFSITWAIMYIWIIQFFDLEQLKSLTFKTESERFEFFNWKKLNDLSKIVWLDKFKSNLIKLGINLI